MRKASLTIILLFVITLILFVIIAVFVCTSNLDTFSTCIRDARTTYVSVSHQIIPALDILSNVKILE